MNENILHKYALFFSIAGFTLLILLFLFSPPQKLSSVNIPQEQELQFQAKITSLHTSPAGTVLKLQRSCVQTGFISADISKDFQNSSVLVTGSLSGDFFSISRLESADR